MHGVLATRESDTATENVGVACINGDNRQAVGNVNKVAFIRFSRQPR
jgi:hypothetical protein